MFPLFSREAPARREADTNRIEDQRTLFELKDDEMESRFASTPSPRYYAVIFTSLIGGDDAGYDAMAQTLVELAERQPGFLGIESTRGIDGLGITVSYWKDEQSIRAWKAESTHAVAQRTGIERWYKHYELRIAKVERAYSGPQGRSVV